MNARRTVIVAAVVLSSLTLAACGGGDEAAPVTATEDAGVGTTAAAAETETAPAPTTDETETEAPAETAPATTEAPTETAPLNGALEPGPYASVLFVPQISFTTPEPGWQMSGSELGHYVDFFKSGTSFPYVAFVSAENDQAYLLATKPIEKEPNRGSDDAGVGLDPVDWTIHLQNHPRLEASEPNEVTVGGFSGVQFELNVKPGQGYESVVCPADRCVALLHSQDPVEGGSPRETVYFLPEGSKAQFTVLDVDGAPFVIVVESTEEAFAQDLEVANGVLETLTIKP